MRDPQRGDRLAGRFRILEVRQRRRDRTVFAAVDLQGRRAVSVHWPRDASGSADLREEVARARGVDHPGLVPLLGLWREGGRHFLVAGRREPEVSLDAVGGVDPVRALRWIADVAGALDALHRAGRVHGDVRPARVHVCGDRARIEPAARSVRLPGEAAPEILEGAQAGVASDVYGLGLLLARAVAGPAFRGPTPWGVQAAQSRLPVLPSSVPRGVRQLVTVCLHPDPARRPRTAGAVARMARRVERAPRRRLRVAAAVPIRWRAGHRVLARQPGAGWVRVGPETSLGTAIRWRDRCAAAGAEVRIVPVALTGRDLVWIAGMALVTGVVVPGFGFLLGGALAWRHRWGRCAPAAGAGLPQVPPPDPPPPLPGRWRMRAIGGLALVAAGLVAVAPHLALIPALGAVAGIASLWWPDRPDPSARIRVARIQAALADAAAAVALHPPPLDEALDLQGRILWARTVGTWPPHVADGWAAEARRHPPTSLPAAVEALSRTRLELEGACDP